MFTRQVAAKSTWRNNFKLLKIYFNYFLLKRVHKLLPTRNSTVDFSNSKTSAIFGAVGVAIHTWQPKCDQSVCCAEK